MIEPRHDRIGACPAQSSRSGGPETTIVTQPQASLAGRRLFQIVDGPHLGRPRRTQHVAEIMNCTGRSGLNSRLVYTPGGMLMHATFWN